MLDILALKSYNTLEEFVIKEGRHNVQFARRIEKDNKHSTSD